MRRVVLTVCYDGTAYGGFQLQPNAPTVQSVMEAALGRLLDEPVRLRAAGRTDAGVHAREQVVDFADSGRRPLGTIVRGGNALLPPDIRILSAAEADPAFDARRHAKSKEYRYYLWIGPVWLPFLLRYAWHIGGPLDLAAMREELAQLVGEHDFSSFRGQGCTARTPVRTILSADLREADGPEWAAGAAGAPGRCGGMRGPAAAAPAAGAPPEGCGTLACVAIRGTGFLRHMVRNIVGTLAEVGKGKIPPGRMRALLDLRDRRRAGPTAPAHGLFLWRVEY